MRATRYPALANLIPLHSCAQSALLCWQRCLPCAPHWLCPLSQRISCCPFPHVHCSRAWLSRRPLKPVAVSFPCQSVVSFCFLLSIVPSIVSRAAAICGHLPTELSAAATVLKQRSLFLSPTFCLLCWFLCFKPDTWLT